MKQNEDIKKMIFQIYLLCEDNLPSEEMENNFGNTLATIVNRFGFNLGEIFNEGCVKGWDENS